MTDNIPQLRFPGFEDEWKEKKLYEVSEKIQDGTHFSPKLDGSNDYKYITSKNIKDGYIDTSDIDYISKDEHLKIFSRCAVEYGDILLTKDGANTGNVCINNLREDFSLLSSVAFIRANKKDAVNTFIFQLLASPSGKREVQRSIAGQAITRITLNKLNNFYFSYPSLPEQTKIADFLTSVDKRISLLQKKKESLELYKKGIMQKIFSQQLRFKDENGNDFPDWKEKKLGDIASIQKGKGISKSDIDEEGLIECIRYGELYTSYKEIISSVISKTNLSLSELFLSKNNDVIIPSSGETQLDIATASCVLKDGVALGGDLNIIRSNENGIFLSYYLNNAKKYDIARISQGISVIHLYASKLRDLKILLPSFAEQEKIASFLSIIDKSIEKVSSQVEQLQSWKKGLLQRMFV